MFLSLRFAVPAVVLAAFIATLLLGPVVPLCIAVALMTYAYIPFKRARWLPVVAFVVVLTPNVAFAAAIDIGQAFGGSLQEIVNGAISALIAGLVGWVAWIFKSKFNIDIEARHREALTSFLQRQASGLVAAGAVKVQGLKVEVQNEQLAMAANSAIASIPMAMQFFGLTPARIQQMIVDLLPKQPAIATAQAVAIDVANPETPSKPAA